MFDGEALGLEVVSATKAHVDKAVAPLLERIADLERREAHYHELELATTQSLVNIEVGYKNAIAALPLPEPKEFDPEPVRAIAQEIVEARLAALPVPENGKDADEVKRVIAETVAALPPVENGKDADPDVVASLVKETVASAVAALPVPQDGKDGAPGEPGKDGSDGKDATPITLADLEPVLRYQLEEAMAELPIPKDGTPGRDGINGKDAVLPDLSVLEYAPDEVATSIALAVKKMAEFSQTRIVEVAEKSIPVTLPTFNFTLADNREPPVVNIEAQPAPVVNMAGPTISVAAPQVHVDIPKRGKEVTTVTGWDKAGRVTSFEKVEADD